MDPHRSEESSGPPPCANGCGFFGNPACDNLCSKCFRDINASAPSTPARPEEPVVAAAAAAVTAAATAATAAATATPTAPTPVTAPVEVPAPAAAPATTSVAGDAGKPGEGVAKPTKQKKPRCGACRKKVGLLGFECRCGKIFCGLHRHADQHECEFDYRSHDLTALAKATGPAVRPEKIGQL